MTQFALIGMLLGALACGMCHGSDKLTDSSQQLPTPSPTPSGDWNAQTRTEQTGSMQTGAGQSENNDLDRIPPSSPEPATPKSKTPAASGANQRIYVENAFTVSSHRGGLIVPAAQEAAQTPWQERLFLDIRKEWKVDNRLNLILSDRLNLRYANDLALPNHENVINDFREGFISWEPRERVYLDIGRINLRSGAALGFNPTDFFKTRAVVEPLTSDPSVLREDRLGTLMLETQYIGQGRALTVALAPALLSSTPVYSNANLPSFNPSIDRTNDHFRLLVKGSFNIGSDFSPELLFYHEGNQIKFGANLTRSFGQRIIAYGEWSGGERTNLIDEALRYGRQTGTLPAAAPSAVPDDPRTRFENDLSLGASYTSSKKITLNLEYHLHQSGFTMKDWSNWFGAGQGQSTSSPIARELWYFREYAVDRQEPLAKQSSFIRVDWIDALIPNLELTGFINSDIYDGSSLVQASAEYYVSKTWTIGAQVNANLGSKRSDFGSLPQIGGILFKVARYF